MYWISYRWLQCYVWQEQLCSSQNFKQCVQGLFTSGAYAILYSYPLHMHLKLCHTTLNSWLQRHTTGSVTVLFASRNTSNYTLCINVGEDPLEILKVSDTCWLSIAPCVPACSEPIWGAKTATFCLWRMKSTTTLQSYCIKCTALLKTNCTSYSWSPFC